MSGAGSNAAGSAASGMDTLVSTDRTIPTSPQATKYDPTARTFTQLTSGEIASMHPVDQAVLFAVTVEKGSIPSAPDTGIDLSAIRDANEDNAQTVVSESVRIALLDLIQNGSIEYIGAPIDSFGDGRVTFFVDYANLKLPGSPTRRVGG